MSQPSSDKELDDIVKQQFKDETGLSTGIKTLTGVSNSDDVARTDIELKTVLTHNQMVAHTLIENVMVKAMQRDAPNKTPILAGLCEKRERKLISVKGRSRDDVVNMVKAGQEVERPKRFWESRA